MMTSREAGEDGVATMRTVGARSFVAKALPRFYREDTDALRIWNMFSTCFHVNVFGLRSCECSSTYGMGVSQVIELRSSTKAKFRKHVFV